MDWHERIVLDHFERDEKYIIKGTHISVNDIIDELANCEYEDEVLLKFSQIGHEDLRAVKAFATEHDFFIGSY